MFDPGLKPFRPSDLSLIKLGNAIQSSSDLGEHPTLQAGYIYLAQFIAHDISFDENISARMEDYIKVILGTLAPNQPKRLKSKDNHAGQAYVKEGSAYFVTGKAKVAKLKYENPS